MKDISTMMNQIFEQHIDQKEISTKTLKSSFKAYIDHFDPDRIYLLEAEVLPYEQMPDSSVQKMLEAYKAGNYQAFEQLNKTIEVAIYRARLLRENIKLEARPLFYSTATFANDSWEDPDLGRPFPKSQSALQERMRADLKRYIDAEKNKFGNAAVMNNQQQTLALYEKNQREMENGYIYRDEKGSFLPAAQQENLFALHILKALASSLDAHTSFYNTSEAQDLKVKLEKAFQGIGVALKQQPDGKIAIGSLTKDGPAYKSKQIQIGDILLAIDGKEISNQPLKQVTEQLRKNDHVEIKLLLQRSEESKPFVVILQKSEIALKSDRVDIAYQKIEGGIIGVIVLHSFYQGVDGITSENDVKQALMQLQSKGEIKGLILDLRENSGGFLNQAVKVAGLFITNGVVVISKYFNGEEHFYRDLDNKSYYQGPMVVLTSRATASAAEIVAQALQDYGIALIVGDAQTYGKGTIQNQTVTKGNGASLFKVTVGRYYTVSGKTPQLNGVKADIVVPGIFNFEHIGEKYLTATIPADTIAPDYDDTLEDIKAPLKPWFVQNYMPTLQQREVIWQKILDTLHARSSQRIAQNPGYQSFLNRLRAISEHKPFPASKLSSEKDSLNTDYQLHESINIVKDMIDLTPTSPPPGSIVERSTKNKN